jgi:hypothetical protein
METLVQPVPRDLSERQGRKDPRDPPDLRAPQDLRDCRGHLGTQDSRDPLARLDPMVRRANKVVSGLLGPLGQPVTLAPQAQLGAPG